VTVSRRDALKLAAAAAAAPLVPSGLAEAASAAPAAAATTVAGRFFGAAEMRLLDELVESIIPTDAHSPGARAAGVAGYIDGRLAAYDPALPELKEEQEKWRAGLAVVESLSRETTGKGFAESSPEEKAALLERLAVGESLPTEEPRERHAPAVEKPETQGQRFFVLLKSWTVRGYYTSKIGLHDEMEYKGNTLLVEFAGTDPATLGPARREDD
jgi:hypothetical protein